KAHGLDKEVGAAAGGIEDAQALDVCRAFPCDKRPQGMAYQVLHEWSRRVKGTRALAATAGNEVEAPRLQTPHETSRPALAYARPWTHISSVVSLAVRGSYSRRPS